MNTENSARNRFAIILPVCNEEACLGDVLVELDGELARVQAEETLEFVVAVGLNGTTDGSGPIAKAKGALVGEAEERGYGHGCVAAIAAVQAAGHLPDAYVFYSGDGANDPRDLIRLIDRYRAGADFVMGSRTMRMGNWRRPWVRSISNVALGWWASLLALQPYSDLGPYRIIDRELFEKMEMREFTWGWTIEPQILAPRLGAKIVEIPVRERERVAGEQKISGVSIGQSLRIGRAIAGAGWRVVRRKL